MYKSNFNIHDKVPTCPKNKNKKKIANAAKAMTLIIRSLDFGSGRTVFLVIETYILQSFGFNRLKYKINRLR